MALNDIGESGLVQIVLAVFTLIGSVLSLMWMHSSKTSVEVFKTMMDEKQRRQEKVENIEELMKQYKKPLIQSAFELQSRLKEQISRNLLHLFNKQGDERRTYVILSTMYLFCEFLGWLEIVRREVVFITGPKAETLNQIIDDIRFQFTGETIIQGVTDKNETMAEDERILQTYKWSVFQILSVELRAIGEAMIKPRKCDDKNPNQAITGLEVISFNDFVRWNDKDLWAFQQASDIAAGRAEAPKSTEVPKFKVAFKPLAKSVARLLELDNKNTPKERITMLQVLLCKLIDILDDGGQNCDDDHSGQFLSRNNRITPMVAKLSPPALKWLAGRPYMEKDHVKEALEDGVYQEWCESTAHDDPLANTWWEKTNAEMARCRALENLTGLDRKYCEDLTPDDLAKLAFPGFRADIRKFPKNKGDLGPDCWFPGAFPPRRRLLPAPHVGFATQLFNRLNTPSMPGYSTWTIGAYGKQHAD